MGDLHWILKRLLTIRDPFEPLRMHETPERSDQPAPHRVYLVLLIRKLRLSYRQLFLELTKKLQVKVEAFRGFIESAGYRVVLC